MNELTEELDALRAMLKDIAGLWASNAGCDFAETTTIHLAMLVRDCVRADREKIAGRELLGNVGTLAATALRTILADADTQVAMDVEAGVLHSGTARAVFGVIRDVVKPFNAQLAEELLTPKTEKARVRE